MKTAGLFGCLWPCLFAAKAQSIDREQLIGTWIGVHTEYDTDEYCPLPTYLQLGADSTYRLGMVDGTAAAMTSTWAVQGNTVRLDTVHFVPGLVNVQNDLLQIGKNYPMTFRKFTDIPVDSASACQQLSGRVWQSANLIVSLYANGRVRVENTTTSQQTAHFWRLVRFGQSVFLVIQGNAYGHDGGYKPLLQIDKLSAKEIQAIGWNGHAVTDETFRFVRNLTPADSFQTSRFQPCDNCFRSTGYHTLSARSANWYALKQLVDRYYQPVNQPGQSGLIQVSFVVNCEGASGLFRVKGFGEDYRERAFTSQITRQFLGICRDYIAVDPFFRNDNEPGSRPYDRAVSLTFRLKDGQFIDLLP